MVITSVNAFFSSDLSQNGLFTSVNALSLSQTGPSTFLIDLYRYSTPPKKKEGNNNQYLNFEASF
jgi:hypothetical protein